MNQPKWQWDEMKQIGTDFSDLHEVEMYDQRMNSFRDIDAENHEMLKMLDLTCGSKILEVGCGTGQFARTASAAGLDVSAVDVSKIMLDYLKKMAVKENVSSITMQHAGFLTMDFPSETFDAVVSGAALHHLPDLWKLPALQNIYNVLKPGGKFILRDVVFVLKKGENPSTCFEKFINAFNDEIRFGALTHIKQEYSTYDWILDGLLSRAGFTTESKSIFDSTFIVYLCQK